MPNTTECPLPTMVTPKLRSAIFEAVRGITANDFAKALRNPSPPSSIHPFVRLLAQGIAPPPEALSKAFAEEMSKHRGQPAPK
jgi:hypothetical protein